MCSHRIMNRALCIEMNQSVHKGPTFQTREREHKDLWRNKAENNVLDIAEVCAGTVSLMLSDTFRGRQATQGGSREGYSGKLCQVNPRADGGGTSTF